MQTLERLDAKSTYDPRWFIWAVVFLLVTGISLVSYILLTGVQDSNDTVFVPVSRSSKK